MSAAVVFSGVSGWLFGFAGVEVRFVGDGVVSFVAIELFLRHFTTAFVGITA
jgi:hypothetical protein